jgi:ABC-type Fe3+-hydroxamate transport system substrate-binding protein
VDPVDVDREYERLEEQARRTADLIKTLGQKLSARAEQGDQNAKEWSLDLREVALAVKDEEQQMQALLNALDRLADAQAREAAARPVYRQPVYYGNGYGNGFFGGGFGQALAMGAGFGLGEEIIEDLF